MENKSQDLYCICCGQHNSYSLVHTFYKKPIGETDFCFSDYFREILRCSSCSHFISLTSLDLSKLYSESYVDRTYQGECGIHKRYLEIMNLDSDDSDNFSRVERICMFAKTHFGRTDNLKILDIGAGIGVFLSLIKNRENWQCTAIEPDKRFSYHLQSKLGIESITCDYRKLKWDRKFDIICLNKVLEHFQNPLELLQSVKNDLNHGGFVYLELPDGEMSSQDKLGFEREEFFVEHHHIFSLKSMTAITKRAGFTTEVSEQIIEPSSKYTLRTFLTH